MGRAACRRCCEATFQGSRPTRVAGSVRMLRKKFPDFENGLIIAAAETADVDYIVTQDKALLAQVPEACITPARALELLDR